MRGIIFSIALMCSSPAMSQQIDLDAIVEAHILPRYATLAEDAAKLEQTSQETCVSSSSALRSAFHQAFNAWISVSHVRFGPSEQDDRAFALAFWPDPRGSSNKALGTLLRDLDPVVETADSFSTVSVAARGFYALELLLYDPSFMSDDSSDYHCALVQAITRDIARNADAILADWTKSYADLITHPSNDTYRSEAEAAQQIFTSLTAALEFTSNVRLGRPMGTFDRPRPQRAEARRSERSLHHVLLSLEATRELAVRLSPEMEAVDQAFSAAINRAEQLDDPVFAQVSTPQGRLRVEVLQQSIDVIRQMLAEEVGPGLGIAAGFNSLDGD